MRINIIKNKNDKKLNKYMKINKLNLNLKSNKNNTIYFNKINFNNKFIKNKTNRFQSKYLNGFDNKFYIKNRTLFNSDIQFKNMINNKFTKSENKIKSFKNKKFINNIILNKKNIILKNSISKIQKKIKMKDINYNIKVNENFNFDNINYDNYLNKIKYKSNLYKTIFQKNQNKIIFSTINKDKIICDKNAINKSLNNKNSKINKKNNKEILIKLLKILKFIKNCNLNLNEFNKNYFPKKPYELPGSKKLFLLVKLNEIKQVKNLLDLNKFYLFQIDYLKRTIFIWSCIRNLNIMIELLLKYKLNINHKDHFNKTPLEYLILNKNIFFIKKLVEWKVELNLSKSIKKLTNNYEIIIIIKKYKNKLKSIKK